MAIVTKSVYDPSAPGDGVRALVTRLWPRGVKKSRVSFWMRDLGPEYPLLKAYKSGKISWPEFSRKYKSGLKTGAAKEALKKLKSIARQKKVTLLCVCREESGCHRTLLKRRLGGK